MIKNFLVVVGVAAERLGELDEEKVVEGVRTVGGAEVVGVEVILVGGGTEVAEDPWAVVMGEEDGDKHENLKIIFALVLDLNRLLSYFCC